MENTNGDPGISHILKANEVSEILNTGRSIAYALMQRGDISTVRIENPISKLVYCSNSSHMSAHTQSS